jgi:hypothetical protein
MNFKYSLFLLFSILIVLSKEILVFNEEILVLFAFGIFREKIGYFRNVMNWIYVFVFVLEILSIIPGLSESANLEYLLSFRILRIFVFL